MCSCSEFSQNISTESKGNALRRTIPDTRLEISNTNTQNIRTTVSDGSGFNSNPINTLVVCNNCSTSYSSANSDICPECEYQNKNEHIDIQAKEEALIPGYVLEPLSENQNSIFIALEESKTLSRNEINPHDEFLSRDGHVELIASKEKITLKNLSSNKAVFIQISTDTELKNGDVIMLGDRNYFILKKKEE